MEILVVGASGLVGRSLLPFLLEAGHRVRRMGRSSRADNVNPSPNNEGGVGAPDRDFAWNPIAGSLDHQALDGVDAHPELATALSQLLNGH